MGHLRLALALMVVVYHLNTDFAHFTGPLAVFGFYTLSGYLITGALSHAYSNRPGAFIVNRALRLYPAYWVCALLGLFVASYGSPLNPAMTVPLAADDIWRQITIFGLLHVDLAPHLVRLVPPAWSLNMEFGWYLAMLVATRSVKVWLVLSSAVAIYCIATNDFAVAYYSYLGPSFCFAVGSAAYQMKWKLVPPVWLSTGLLAAIMAAGNFIPAVGLLYASSVTVAALILGLREGVKTAPLDRLAGELSYPVFLSHSAVASLIGLPVGWALFLIALPATLAVSAAIVLFIERPMEVVREMVRHNRRAVAV